MDADTARRLNRVRRPLADALMTAALCPGRSRPPSGTESMKRTSAADPAGLFRGRRDPVERPLSTSRRSR